MWKRIRSMATLTIGLTVLILGPAPLLCHAQLISSFENNLSSTVGATWEGPGIANSEFVTTGATDGTYALAVHHSPGWNIQLILKGGMQLAQAAASHDFLVMDVSTTDLGTAGDGWSPNWRQVFEVFNSNQGGWQQSQLDVHPVAADDGGSATATLILDLTAPQGTSPSIKDNAQAFVNSGGGQGTYWELFLPIQGGDQGTPIKAGDYASDSVVNASDYVTWRKTFGGTVLPNETVTPGSVDAADYSEWRAHFGADYTLITTIIDNVRFANAGSGSVAQASTGVPEPSSAVLAMVAAVAVAGRRRKSE
jgi:PEP-CTERM motif